MSELVEGGSGRLSGAEPRSALAPWHDSLLVAGSGPHETTVAQAIRERFAAIDGVELEIPLRQDLPRAADLLRAVVIIIDTDVISEMMRDEPAPEGP